MTSRRGGNVPMLVGGTMLYYRALFRGIAELPTADAALRAALDARAAREGWPALHAELAARDPASAARIHSNDAQRIQRALEVLELSAARSMRIGRMKQAMHNCSAPGPSVCWSQLIARNCMPYSRRDSPQCCAPVSSMKCAACSRAGWMPARLRCDWWLPPVHRALPGPGITAISCRTRTCRYAPAREAAAHLAALRQVVAI